MSYDKMLNDKFADIVINLVRHDTSPTGLPCYIEAHLGSTPKDRGAVALDLGNYISRRLGLRYQMVPEYRGKGKKTTIRWFMSWEDVEPIIPNIHNALGKWTGSKHLPFEFNSLIIQNSARGVRVPDAA